MTKRTTGFLVVAALIVVASVGWLVLKPGSNSPESSTPSPSNSSANSSKADTTTNSSTTIGSANAKLTITEYGDFKCPQCNKFYFQSEPQLKKDYIDTGKVKLEFKPIAIIGPDSKAAAAASLCAADAEKFEAYHNQLFESIGNDHYKKSDFSIESKTYFSNEKLKQLGRAAGITSPEFEVCVEGGKHLADVDSLTSEASSNGINGTPTFIIGSQTIRGAQPYSVIKAVIESQLKQ